MVLVIITGKSSVWVQALHCFSMRSTFQCNIHRGRQYTVYRTEHYAGQELSMWCTGGMCPACYQLPAPVQGAVTF